MVSLFDGRSYSPRLAKLILLAQATTILIRHERGGHTNEDDQQLADDLARPIMPLCPRRMSHSCRRRGPCRRRRVTLWGTVRDGIVHGHTRARAIGMSSPIRCRSWCIRG